MANFGKDRHLAHDAHVGPRSCAWSNCRSRLWFSDGFERLASAVSDMPNSIEYAYLLV